MFSRTLAPSSTLKKVQTVSCDDLLRRQTLTSSLHYIASHLSRHSAVQYINTTLQEHQCRDESSSELTETRNTTVYRRELAAYLMRLQLAWPTWPLQSRSPGSPPPHSIAASLSRRTSPQSCLVPLQTPVSCLLVVDHWLRISILLCCGFSSSAIWIVDGLSLYICQLWHPLSNVMSVDIELLALQPGIENSEVWLWINSTAGRETPASVVACEIAIDEMFHEPFLAHTPVYQQMFGQE